MKTFNLTVALDVSAYANIEIAAETSQEAIAKIKEMIDADTLWDTANPEWEYSDGHRIVSLVDESTNDYVLEAIPYDSDLWTKLFADKE